MPTLLSLSGTKTDLIPLLILRQDTAEQLLSLFALPLSMSMLRRLNLLVAVLLISQL